MTRRALFQIAIGTGARPQKWGATNSPQCPVCRSPLPKDTPEYLPIIMNTDGSQAALANVRDCFCSACGTRFVVSS